MKIVPSDIWRSCHWGLGPDGTVRLDPEVVSKNSIVLPQK